MTSHHPGSSLMSGEQESGFRRVCKAAWWLTKWFVGLTVFLVASEVLELALGLGHYWTGALILTFAIAGYVGGRLDAALARSENGQ